MNINILLEIGKIILVIIVTIIIAYNSIVLSIALLRKAGCVMLNYRGNEVVFGAGIAFLPVVLTLTSLLSVLYINQYSLYVSYLFAIFSIGFVGLLDDLIGDKQIKGLKKHTVSFLKGQLTTGFAKALIGFITSVVISLGISGSFIELTLNTLIIALFTNALNLMDLRPGRCIKTFLFAGFIIYFSSLKAFFVLMPLLILLVGAIVYLRYDLREVCMLGDTGSNILGITLGFFSTLAFDLTSKVMLLVILLAVNAIAEKFSISKIIASNRFLNFLDSLGRSGS